jgi:hypothetical protein
VLKNHSYFSSNISQVFAFFAFDYIFSIHKYPALGGLLQTVESSYKTAFAPTLVPTIPNISLYGYAVKRLLLLQHLFLFSV